MDHPSAPSSGASSPPDTPVSTPLSSYPSGAFPGSHPGSQRSSPHPAPVSAFETTTVLPSRSGHSPLSVGFPPATRSLGGVQGRPEEAFNAYAGYSDYSALMPGTVASTSRSAVPNADGSAVADPSNAYPPRSCVPPALLHHSANNTPEGTPASSRVASPALRNVAVAAASTSVSSATASGQHASSSGSPGSNTPRASTTLSRPATSLLLSKPFKCPKPNCNKSYKQANGLKYHITHGSCNFAPPKDLEQIQALLDSKRKDGNDEPMSEAELREVEREAERRLRPYACGVGDCQRRYKNMNGLRMSISLNLFDAELTVDLQGTTTSTLVITERLASRCLPAASTSVFSTASRDTTRRRRHRTRQRVQLHHRRRLRLFRHRRCPGRRPPSQLSTPRRTYHRRTTTQQWRRRSTSRHTTSSTRRRRLPT